MNILALDLGTVTGFALSPTHGAVVTGTWNNKGGRYEGGGMRYLRFRNALDEMHKLTPLEAVYFEEVRRHNGTDAAHVYGGMLATLTSWCEQHSVPYLGVPIQTIKKFICGRANGSKEDVIAATEKLGYQPKDSNEADAIALLLEVLAR
jgi:Holliday junction resolvasome RuvABC endonuclease subunit